MMGAGMYGADLRGCVFDDASLLQADLRMADARGASFRGANLRQADFCGADLAGADMRDADLARAALSLGSSGFEDVRVSSDTLVALLRLVLATMPAGDERSAKIRATLSELTELSSYAFGGAVPRTLPLQGTDPSGGD